MLFVIKSSKIVCGETLLFLKGGNAMNEFKVPEGWEVGHKDGYYTKTIKVGNCTCIIHRPFLTDEERKKREEEVCRALAALLRK